MNKKFFFSAILAIALIIGMTVIGCDNNPDNNNPDNGGVYNPLSGKTYYEMNKIISFSVTANNDSNGTYTLKNRVYIWLPDEYKFVNGEAGTYTWNEVAKTVTLIPEKASVPTIRYGDRPADPDYELLDKTAYRSLTQFFLDKLKEEDGDDGFNQWLLLKGFSSADDYIDAMAGEAFADKTAAYSFSTDGKALFFDDPLPANNGTNELSGYTYYGTKINNGEYDIDTTRVFGFTSSGYAFIWDNGANSEIKTGAYAYDSEEKRVWLKPLTIDGLDRNAYYAKQTAMPGNYFDDDYAYRAAVTIKVFWSEQYEYDTEHKGMIKR